MSYRRIIRWMLSLCPSKKLSKLELLLQSLSGKGWIAGIGSETAAIRKILFKNEIEMPVLYDVGANIGDWSADFLKNLPTTKIHLFEPSTETFQALEKRFKDFHNTKLNNVALGAKNEFRNLYSDNLVSGLASFSKRNLDYLGINFNRKEEVRVQTLDSYIKTHMPPDIIKIDVEGHEMEVLEGATKALEVAKIIEFEFGGANIDSRTFFKDFYYFFRTKNFNVYRLTPRGLMHLRDYKELDECFRNTTYICLSDSLSWPTSPIK